MTHTSTEQPEALRLADALAERVSLTATGFGFDADLAYAAAELRRLHAENEGLRKELRSAQAAPQAVQQHEHNAQPGKFSSGDAITCINVDGATHITKGKEYTAGIMGRNPGVVFVKSDAGTAAVYRADRFVISAANQTQPGLDAEYQRGYQDGYNRRDADVKGALI